MDKKDIFAIVYVCWGLSFITVVALPFVLPATNFWLYYGPALGLMVVLSAVSLIEAFVSKPEADESTPEYRGAEADECTAEGTPFTAPSKKRTIWRYAVVGGVVCAVIALSALAVNHSGEPVPARAVIVPDESVVIPELPETWYDTLEEAQAAADAYNAALDALSVSEIPSEASDVTEPEEVTRDNSTAKEVMLFSGVFTVGDTIEPGRYVFTSEGSGNFVIETSDGDLRINEILNDDASEAHGVLSITCDIGDSDTIEISGIDKVICTPAETKMSTTLTTGYWFTGIDAPAGRYTVTPGGGSGNFVVFSDDSIEVNEILGGDYGVSKVVVDFEDGDLICISGLRRVYLSMDQ